MQGVVAMEMADTRTVIKQWCQEEIWHARKGFQEITTNSTRNCRQMCDNYRAIALLIGLNENKLFIA
ncbi:hypothetical protein X777_14064 [Ooceraea biroi]|uniref:Uncharacterized protein n=1 Tax=Ooceraea biroi TaxID=2015173 RepID=A0A026VZ97_OOCBI|nr:hypothetical protein X777_14064 [Ooceraea biroi]